ncbi:Cytochrome bo(3) ubiquinol oxidase subunit 4 [Paraburkholderia caffeinitolerans]|uniref:Cytochrome bo(3) ubiquinol oxidase subunit 4 n=1 Tax=Paraburkholderia caffeinitolerans TaxID=1723730 RepID=A0A6J5G7T0_9BURK|nr:MULTISPECIES: cytochrome o ubiquinol oxidase subunit IV [Paraburkholderia]CAB3793594.1 Cytochrome bo(3) ubiquinol oxidase subunit 4 [Paraburkholderia caffeinitolerans]
MTQAHATHPIDHDDAHGSLKGYMVGTILSLVLTLASFGVVIFHLVSPGVGLAAIVVLCIAQLVVQLVYFLHIGASRSQRANTGIFVCTALLIAVIVGLSLWVMHNANVNMMPTQMSVDRAMAHD